MLRQQKPTPEKCCELCGSKLERRRLKSGRLESLLHFSRRKYCNRKCMAMAFDQRHTGESWAAEHREARQLTNPGPCERCGQGNARDVHHRSGDWHDNKPENLQRICRGCHNREHRKRKPCTICGKPQKGLGYCNAHYIRFKKFGDPLAYHIPPKKPCLIQGCTQMANAKGLCGRHYMRAKRKRSKE